MNGSPSSKFLFACGARTCHFPSLRCSEWSGDGGVCASSRHPESRLGGRLWHRPRGPQLTSYLKSLGGRLWPECRPELRNHGVGWVRAVERLRNGGVPPNAVFLMPATHCTGEIAPEIPFLPVLQYVILGLNRAIRSPCKARLRALTPRVGPLGA